MRELQMRIVIEEPGRGGMMVDVAGVIVPYNDDPERSARTAITRIAGMMLHASFADIVAMRIAECRGQRTKKRVRRLR